MVRRRVIDRLVCGTGVLLCVMGLVCNEWTVSTVALHGEPIPPEMRRTVWSFSVICLVVGLLLVRFRSRLFSRLGFVVFGTAARRQRLYKIVVVAAPFVFAEFLIRWAGCCSTYMERNLGRYVSPYNQINKTPWILDSGIMKRYTFARPEYDYEVVTNSEGVRDREHPVEKARGEYRIVCLGDSFTLGMGAAYDDIYPKVLERRLNELDPLRRVTVINAGVSGSDPVYSYYLFVQRLRKYSPDLVTLMINDSDVEDIIARGGMDRFGPDGILKRVDPPRIEWLFAHCHLVRACMIVFLRYDYLMLGPRERPKRVEATIPVFLEVCKRLQDLGEKDGFEFLLAIQPFSFRFLEKTVPGYLATLEEGLERHEVRYADLTDSFEAGMAGRTLSEYMWPLDRHYNAKGYALLAEALETALLERFSGERYPWAAARGGER